MPSATIVGAMLSLEKPIPMAWARSRTVAKKLSLTRSFMVRRISRSTRSVSAALTTGTPAMTGSHGMRSYPRRRMNSCANVSDQFWQPHSHESTWRYFTTCPDGSSVNFANQLSMSLLTAFAENLSHSSPLPPPAVSLVCPVEICPIFSMRYRPSGSSVSNVPSAETSRRIILSRGVQSLPGSCSSVVSCATRHTLAAFPSQWCILGCWWKTRLFSLSVGFHFAASRSSEPGSVPSGVHEKR